MFSIFDYLRRLVRDSVLAGVQDAFEVMDQGDHRDDVGSAALRLLERAGATAPQGAARAPVRAAPRVPPPPPAQVPPPAPAPGDLIPAALSLPSPELPALEGYGPYERRKKGPGKPPRPQGGRP